MTSRIHPSEIITPHSLDRRGACRVCFGSPRTPHFALRNGFSLIELLVVIAILAMLVGILLPSLTRAKLLARVVQAHADLRNLTVSLAMYAESSGGPLPPARTGCALAADWELPRELAGEGYLPARRDGAVRRVDLTDPFDPTGEYRYRAPGDAIINEAVLLANEARLWVPEDFPRNASEAGVYFDDPRQSPARYAVYSHGPEPAWLAGQPAWGRSPLPAAFWFPGGGSDRPGLITHFAETGGGIFASP